MRSAPIRWILLALLLTAPLAGCSNKDENPNGPRQLEMAQDRFVFQRSDSTGISMGSARAVCCGIFEPGVIDQPAMKIVSYDPPNTRSEWEIDIFTNVAVEDTTYKLPLAPPGANPPPVYIRVYDRHTGTVTTSSAADASGSITLHSFSCGSAIQMHVEADAVLGDTTAGDQVRMQGYFQGAYPAKSCN